MFSKLDLAHTYQQLRLDVDFRQYVTFNTHKGLFCYTWLPFGVSAAPAIFQRTMEAILRDLPHVSIYLDGILVTGESEATHLQNLSAVLERLKAAGVCLKQEKCSFMMSEVEYLGHRISAKGLQPLPSKVRVIQEAPTPTEVSQLRSFPGLLGYYGRFLPDLATILSPLYELLQSSRKWGWEELQWKAFQEAKNLLNQSNVLTHYDPKKPLYLLCNDIYGTHRILDRYICAF